MTLHVAALKTGFGVPEGDFDGTVHSVFKRALILAVDGSGLVTLVAARSGALPAGITLDAGDDLPFDRLAGAGARGAARGGILRFAEGSFSIDLRPALAWRSRLHELSVDLGSERSRQAWLIAADILAEDGRYQRFARIAGDLPSALVAATRNRRRSEASAIAGRLVGLGEGGTPAGDDFLVGFTAALHATTPGDGRRGYLQAFSDHIREIANRTNDVSRVYLTAAATGEVSEKLTLLAARIAEGAASGAVTEAAAAAIAVGHTSGADGTLGLLAGLASSGPDTLVSRFERLLERAWAFTAEWPAV